jgi:hypothetical protein
LHLNRGRTTGEAAEPSLKFAADAFAARVRA